VPSFVITPIFEINIYQICAQYVVFFNSFVFLTDNESENMIFAKWVFFS